MGDAAKRQRDFLAEKDHRLGLAWSALSPEQQVRVARALAIAALRRVGVGRTKGQMRHHHQ